MTHNKNKQVNKQVNKTKIKTKHKQDRKEFKQSYLIYFCKTVNFTKANKCYQGIKDQVNLI